MRRGPKPTKSKEAKVPVARKSLKDEGAKVRDLEKQLAEALRDKAEAQEKQAATAEILRVISSSPMDVQPVFDTIANSAMRLCDGNFGNVATYDGDLLHLVAYANVTAEGVGLTQRMFPMRPSRETVLGRVVLQKAVVHIPDAQADVEYLQPLRAALRGGSAIGVPILHGGDVVGSIAVGRSEARPFADKEIDLLKTFADQAVIAIENVRLFNELEARNRDLTATSEILQVISRSPTDVQPVFEAIVDNAHRLFRSVGTVVLRYDGDFLSPAALRVSAETREWVPRLFPMRPSPDSAVGRCVLTRAAVHLADYEGPDAPAGVRDVARAGGWRSAPRCADVPGRADHRSHLRQPRHARSLCRPGNRAPPNLRRSGRHRHRECPAVHGATGK
jgi:two-component system NtrC family sensor kinase